MRAWQVMVIALASFVDLAPAPVHAQTHTHVGAHVQAPVHKHEATPTDSSRAEQKAASESASPSDLPFNLPIPTAADRAAAFPDLHGMSMQAHMSDNPVIWKFSLERFEWRNFGADDASLAWEGDFWIGPDFDRALIRFEGERELGRTEANAIEVMWQHAFARWWTSHVGLRQEFRPGPSETHLAFGVAGDAPQKIEMDLTAWVGAGAQGGFEFEAERKFLLTNQWQVMTRAAIEGRWRDETRRDIEAGLEHFSTGLRLHYEIRREFSPYVGLEWVHDFHRDGHSEWQALAGLKVWF